MALDRPLDSVRRSRLKLKVVLDRSDRGVQGDVEVIVELGPLRRVPGDRPAHAPLVGRELLVRRSRDGCQGPRRPPRRAAGETAETAALATAADRLATCARLTEPEEQRTRRGKCRASPSGPLLNPAA